MAKFGDISRESLEEVPFLAKPFPSGSIVPGLVFFVGGEWHSWLAVGGTLRKVKMWPSDSTYFGDRPECETDRHFPLLEMLAQRTLRPETARPMAGLLNDFCGMAASLAKVRLFHCVRSQGVNVRRFAETGLEYLLMVARSVFDLLQEIVAAHWAAIEVGGHRHKRKLPSSFGDVVREGDGLRTAKEIEEKYSLITPLAEWYAAQAPDFMVLRSLRDKLLHRGESPAEIIYVTERGFAIDRHEKPFSELYEWPVECELPNRLVPLRPVLCRIIQITLQACDRFAKVLIDHVQLPPEAVPGLHYYSRSDHDKELSQIPTVLAQSLWCDS